MKVKFVPQNVEFEIKPGESVMHLAEDNGLYVKSVCRGVPSCAECRVRIVEGETNVFAPVAAELALVGSGWFIDRRRLACQLQCIGDVTIDMSEQLAKQQGLIGGRKAKAAKALGDRVEDETVIRESTSGPRSGGRSDARGESRNRSNEKFDDEASDETSEESGQDSGQASGQSSGATSGATFKGAPKNPRVIAPRPNTEPRAAISPTAIVSGGAAGSVPGGTSGISPGRIEPRPQGGPVPVGDPRSSNEKSPGGPAGGPSGENRGGGGRSRRGRRR